MATPLVNGLRSSACAGKRTCFYAKAWQAVGNPVISTSARVPVAIGHFITARPWPSAEFTEESKQKRPQRADGRSLQWRSCSSKACIEAMKTGAIVGIQDMMGRPPDWTLASTCEMGSRGEVGIEIELDRVPPARKPA